MIDYRGLLKYAKEKGAQVAVLSEEEKKYKTDKIKLVTPIVFVTEMEEEE